METTLVKIDPKEYGLEEKNVSGIVNAFTPKIQERDALNELYKSLIVKELSPELSIEAGDLRRKLVKVRTGIRDIHKTEKAYFLAAGKFVDAWKNKETLPITQMEEKLSEIEKHAENLEKERVAKLEIERLELLLPYNVENANMLNVGVMDETVWTNFLSGTKAAHEAKIKEEQRIEAERIEAEEKAKKEAEEQRKKEIAEAEARAKEKADKEAKIRIDEEKKRTLLAELRAQRTGELAPYIQFIRKYDNLIGLPEKEYQKELSEIKQGAIEHLKYEKEQKEIARLAEEDRIEEEKQAAIKAEKQRQEKAEKDRLEKEEAEKQAAIEKELSKGDAAKVRDLISDLQKLKEKYTFKSKKNCKMYADVSTLLDRTISHINIKK